MQLIFCQRIALEHEVVHSPAHIVSIRFDLQYQGVFSRLEMQFLRNGPAPHVPAIGKEGRRHTSGMMAVREYIETKLLAIHI